MKRDGLKKEPCQKCLVPREEMDVKTFERQRTMHEMLKKLKNIRISRGTDSTGDLVEKLEERSLPSFNTVY